MNIIAIDIGTYSIKILNAILERKKIKYVSFQEIVVDEFLKENNLEMSAKKYETHNRIVKTILDTFQGKKQKVIFQCPNSLLTYRFLNLPVKNKNKAEKMIPFQLEEDLLFSSSNFHSVSTLLPGPNGIFAISAITAQSEFSDFVQNMEQLELSPDILTTELSLFQSMINSERLHEPYMILDIGHSSSKAYLVHNQKIVSTHVDYFGGKNITDALIHTYNISHDEAILFKHKNCFLLTEGQYNLADEKQKEFSNLMKKIFNSLITDLHMWLLGFRLTHNTNITKILITGGTSKVKNIENYISEQTLIPTQHLSIFDSNHIKNIPEITDYFQNFNLAHLYSLSFLNKSLPVNLLTSKYSSASAEHIPLHSAAFIGIRVISLLFIITFTFIIEKFYLNNQLNNLDNRIQNILKNPALEISKKDQRNFKTNLQKTISNLKSREKNIDHQQEFLSDLKKIDSLESLYLISKTLPNNPNVSMLSFDTTPDETRAIFTVENPDLVKDLKAKLNATNLKISQLEFYQDKKQLILNYRY
ncbi:MAG: pilus assembly protein PilM [Bacteriovoracaceae bacterium]